MEDVEDVNGVVGESINCNVSFNPERPIEAFCEIRMRANWMRPWKLAGYLQLSIELIEK